MLTLPSSSKPLHLHHPLPSLSATIEPSACAEPSHSTPVQPVGFNSFISLILVAERVAARTNLLHPSFPAPAELAVHAPAWALLQRGAIFLKAAPTGALPFIFWLRQVRPRGGVD